MYYYRLNENQIVWFGSLRVTEIINITLVRQYGQQMKLSRKIGCIGCINAMYNIDIDDCFRPTQTVVYTQMRSIDAEFDYFWCGIKHQRFVYISHTVMYTKWFHAYFTSTFLKLWIFFMFPNSLLHYTILLLLLFPVINLRICLPQFYIYPLNFFVQITCSVHYN